MSPAQLASIEDAVIHALRGRPDGEDPLALLDELLRDGLSDIEVRRAIWRLIDRGDLDFTPERRLRLRQVTPAD